MRRVSIDHYKMAPRETENNDYAKFWGDKQGALWYVMVFSVVVSKREIKHIVLSASVNNPTLVTAKNDGKCLATVKEK